MEHKPMTDDELAEIEEELARGHADRDRAPIRAGEARALVTEVKRLRPLADQAQRLRAQLDEAESWAEELERRAEAAQQALTGGQRL